MLRVKAQEKIWQEDNNKWAHRENWKIGAGRDGYLASGL